MQVKSISECSNGSILQYFPPPLSSHLSLRTLFSLFLSGRLRQVLQYLKIIFLFLNQNICCWYSKILLSIKTHVKTDGWENNHSFMLKHFAYQATHVTQEEEKQTNKEKQRHTNPGLLFRAGLRVSNRKMIFLFLNQNICCGYSKESSQSGGSFKHPKHILKVMGKKIFTILCWNFLLSKPLKSYGSNWMDVLISINKFIK